MTISVADTYNHKNMVKGNRGKREVIFLLLLRSDKGGDGGKLTIQGLIIV